MIHTVTFIRDSRRFIRQHFRMYAGMAHNYGLFVPHQIENGAWFHGEADDSLDIVRREFPEVEIVFSDYRNWDCHFLNTMIAIGVQRGADKVLIFHADVVMEPEEFAKLCEFIDQTDYDIYKLNMQKCTINYYGGDLQHGIRNCLDIEPIAVKASVRFPYGIYDYPADWYKTAVIEGITNHHFCGWKGPGSTQEFVNGPEGAKMTAEYGEWMEAPSGIKAMFP